MSSFGLRLMLCSCLACAAGLSSARGDVLALKGGKTVSGVFEGFRGDRIHFAPAEGPKIQEPLMRVESLEVDPPAKVAVRPRSGRRIEDIRFRGYRPPDFTFERDGKPLTMRSATVGQIEAELDFSRSMALQRAARAVPAGGELTDVAALLKTGTVTVVQFHMPSSIPSTRQGNYIQGLAEQSHGKIHLAVIPIDGFESPAAVKHGIAAVPQFWFYSRGGKVVKKLAGRFTEAEIDQALRDARRAAP